MKFFKSESAVDNPKKVVESRILKLFCYNAPHSRYEQITSGYYNFFEILSALGIGTHAEQIMLGNILIQKYNAPSQWFQTDTPTCQMESISKTELTTLVNAIASSDCHITAREPGFNTKVP